MQEINKLDKGELIALLDSFGLPISDLDNKAITFYSFKEKGELIGCGAVERTGASPLIRSLAVRKSFQKKGVGHQILTFIESVLAKEDYPSAYLMTEIPAFFKAHGYRIVDKNSAPDEIKQTREFSNLCPDSAQLMMKSIA